MENRFELVNVERIPVSGYHDGMTVVILRDRQTGVMYIANSWGYPGGLTPLLDKDGKPVIAS